MPRVRLGFCKSTVGQTEYEQPQRAAVLQVQPEGALRRQQERAVYKCLRVAELLNPKNRRTTSNKEMWWARTRR